MVKILFVCHGNICRSPMAEFIMKDLVKKAGLADDFLIASAAVSREEIGCDMYLGAREKLAEKGVAFSKRKARQVAASDYADYDYILVMDRQNLADIRRIIKNDAQGKIKLLLSYCGRDSSVADPWYTGDFEKAYEDILAGCTSLLAHIKKSSRL
jgi:protein-tyrosine phosphatase